MGSPGVKTHSTNQHSGPARLQDGDHPPVLRTPNRVITRSSQPTKPAAKQRQAKPHHNTDTTRLSGDTQRPRMGRSVSGELDGQPRAHVQPPRGLAEGAAEGGRRRGRAKARELVGCENRWLGEGAGGQGEPGSGSGPVLAAVKCVKVQIEEHLEVDYYCSSTTRACMIRGKISRLLAACRVITVDDSLGAVAQMKT